MQDHSIYTEQITLDEGDVDYRGLMRPSALLRCAEHMATAHAWGLGMTKPFTARGTWSIWWAGRPSSFTACPPCGRPSP